MSSVYLRARHYRELGMKELDFASLLCSRLCHDLVSPVGAINNGIEIMEDEDSPEMREQVMDLLKQSATLTSNKLKFFRIAFGAAGGFGSELDVNEARNAVVAFYENAKVDIEWQSSLVYAPKVVIKLLLNLALVVGESVIGAGKLRVSLSEDDDTIYAEVIAQADRIIMSPAVIAAVNGDVDETALEARIAPAVLIAGLCEEYDLTCQLLDVDDKNKGFSVSICKKILKL